MIYRNNTYEIVFCTMCSYSVLILFIIVDKNKEVDIYNILDQRIIVDI